MIASDGVHEDDHVLSRVKEARLGPAQISHLVDEGALTDNSPDEVDRERPIVRICVQDSFQSTSR